MTTRDEQLAAAVKQKLAELLDTGANGYEVLNATTAVLITALTESQGPEATARILRGLADAVLAEGARDVLN